MRGARTRKAKTAGAPAQPRHTEKGAALITAVLMSLLLLAAGGALITVTSMTAANAADATAESQAYYAAEAGLQEILSAVRGDVAPNPLISGTQTDSANKMTLRKALTVSTSNKLTDTSTMARLSRWLNYDSTYTDRVTLNSNYSPLSGMAFSVESISDPDNSDTVIFSTSGTFSGGSSSQTFGSCCSNGNNNGFILSYTAASTTTVSTLSSGDSGLGSFTILDAKGTYTVPANQTFTLTINQTAPWTSSTTITGTITGSVTKSGSTITSALVITFPQQTYSLGGVYYQLKVPPFVLVNPTATLAIPGGGATTTASVTLTAPEPQRLLFKVKGYGPRNAVKRMQMLVGKSYFTYNAKGAITLRSADDNSQLTYNAGNSAQYQYDGYDNAGGSGLPAFSVTSDTDYNYINGLHLPTGQVFGSSGVSKVSVSSLDSFLQTTDGIGGARALVDSLRTAAKNQVWPTNCTGTSDQCDRYFASGETPSDFGASQPNGLFTFVDGDVDLPPGGGAGLLVVTGTLTLRGSSSFDGLILVLGTGSLVRDGGGNGNSLGAVAVAHFDPTTGNFLPPTFNSSGSGNSSIQYDSDWVRKALNTTGPGVLAVSEY